MRTHRHLLLLALLPLTFLFNGCFQIYFDVVANPDGTYLLKETIGLSKEVLKGLYDMQKAFSKDSTAAYSEQAMLDSSRASFQPDSVRRKGEALIGHHGITSFAVSNKVEDTMILYTSQIGVSNFDSLPSAFHALTQEIEAKSSPADNSELILRTSRTKEGQVLKFHSVDHDTSSIENDQQAMAELFFKDAAFHIRVFAPRLAPQKNKHVKTIPGGQGFSMRLLDAMKKGASKTLDATFTILKP